MPWIFSRSGEYPSAEKTPIKEHHGLLFYGALLAVEDESFFLGHIEQVDDVCIMVSVILSVDETHHCVWPIHQGIGPQCHPSSFGKISCDILSPKGTHRNLYLLRWVLNIVRSDASSVRCIPKKALLLSTLKNLVAPMRT